MNFKKIILPLILFLMLMPFMVNAETCDLDKISIDSITIKEKVGNATEIEPPVIEGKKIKVNLKMMEVNDSIEYKLAIKNDSNEDYELDKNSFDANSDYIEYTLKSNDKNLVVKAGKTKEVYLKVQYKNEVPNASFNEGKFNNNKSFVLNLSNGQTIAVPDIIKNPKTGYSLIMLILICILCVGITMYAVLSKKKINKFMMLLLTLMITIPASVYALCKIDITVESNVTIEKGLEVAYLLNDGKVLFEDNEKDYFKTNFTECETIYIGETKYNYCSWMIKKDTTLYLAGSTANLKEANIKFLVFDYVSECEYTPENIYRCDSNIPIEEYSINRWCYDNVFNQYGYTYDSTDKQVMNFATYYSDYWDSDSYFMVNAPQTFTMPNHSVLFAVKEGHETK